MLTNPLFCIPSVHYQGHSRPLIALLHLDWVRFGINVSNIGDNIPLQTGDGFCSSACFVRPREAVVSSQGLRPCLFRNKSSLQDVQVIHLKNEEVM